MIDSCSPLIGRLRTMNQRRWKLLFVTYLLTAMCLSAGCRRDGGSASDVGAPPPALSFSVAVDDMNGDGVADIVATVGSFTLPPPHFGLVSVFVNDPMQPGSFSASEQFAAGEDSVGVAIGDLDGDGLLDLAVANYRTDDVSVLLQEPTEPGAFQAATSYPTGRLPESVAIGDLDGDGRADLAVANNHVDSPFVSVLFQDPTLPGSFLPTTAIPTSRATSSVVIGDVDGDALLDVVATGGMVFILLQDPATPGTFFPAVEYAAGPQPVSVALGDLDGDGFLDIAVANLGEPEFPQTASLSVLLQDAGTPGTFFAAVNSITGHRSEDVVIGDIDLDGRADIAVANGGSLQAPGTTSVFLQDPATPGSFLPPTNYRVESLAVAITDLDGDGFPDLVTASEGVRVLFQDPVNPGLLLPPVELGN